MKHNFPLHWYKQDPKDSSGLTLKLNWRVVIKEVGTPILIAIVALLLVFLAIVFNNKSKIN